MTITARTILADVRVVAVDRPGLPIGEPVDIEVVAGRIGAIAPHRPDREPVIDGHGRILMPGLVNAHEHLYSKELRSPDPGMDIRQMRRQIDRRDEATTLAVMLRNAWRSMVEGVLVIRDLGALHGLDTSLASIIAEGIVPGPTIVAAGRPIVMTGGHVWGFGREADGPDDCRRAVREQRKAGARVIKVMASGGVSNYPHEDYTVCEFTPVELAAIASEASRLGLPTCAHAYGRDAVDAAIEAGIDGIEHGVHLDDATVATMASRGISYVPTMANMQRIASPELNDAAGASERADRFRREIVEPQVASVGRAIAAGVRIGVGTDSTGTYRDELAALSAAGMGRDQLIRAATIDGAEICRVDAGLVEVGRLALFSLYDADPRSDPAMLTDPAAVFASGALWTAAELGRLGAVTRPG
jgi:imidazolonepropionase-like amidohydrolase